MLGFLCKYSWNGWRGLFLLVEQSDVILSCYFFRGCFSRYCTGLVLPTQMMKVDSYETRKGEFGLGGKWGCCILTGRREMIERGRVMYAARCESLYHIDPVGKTGCHAMMMILQCVGLLQNDRARRASSTWMSSIKGVKRSSHTQPIFFCKFTQKYCNRTKENAGCGWKRLWLDQTNKRIVHEGYAKPRYPSR